MLAEALEPRRLLAAEPVAATFARFDGGISNADPVVVFDFSVRQEDFTLVGGTAILGFQATAGDGSSVDPAQLVVRDDDGNVV